MTWTNKAYCSTDEVKAALDKTLTDQDDLIDALIPQAQAAIDAYLGFTWQTEGTAASPATRTYDGNGSTQLLIDRCLSLVQVKTQTYTLSTDGNGTISRTADTPTDITEGCWLGPSNLEAGFILERINAYFPVGKRNIVVRGVWGKSATIPDDIKRACIRLTIHYVKQLDASYQDKTANGQYGALVFQQQIPPDVCALLDRHRPRIFSGR
jgi:hypothetical protein